MKHWPFMTIRILIVFILQSSHVAVAQMSDKDWKSYVAWDLNANNREMTEAKKSEKGEFVYFLIPANHPNLKVYKANEVDVEFFNSFYVKINGKKYFKFFVLNRPSNAESIAELKSYFGDPTPSHRSQKLTSNDTHIGFSDANNLQERVRILKWNLRDTSIYTAIAATNTLNELNKLNPDAEIRFMPESIGAQFIANNKIISQFLSREADINTRLKKGEKIYPMHSILGSLELQSLFAKSAGMNSPEEWVEKILIPHFAKTMAQMHHIHHLYHCSHAQNTVAVFKNNTLEYIPIRDLQDAYFDETNKVARELMLEYPSVRKLNYDIGEEGVPLTRADFFVNYLSQVLMNRPSSDGKQDANVVTHFKVLLPIFLKEYIVETEKILKTNLNMDYPLMQLERYLKESKSTVTLHFDSFRPVVNELVRKVELQKGIIKKIQSSDILQPSDENKIRENFKRIFSESKFVVVYDSDFHRRVIMANSVYKETLAMEQIGYTVINDSIIAYERSTNVILSEILNVDQEIMNNFKKSLLMCKKLFL